MSKKYRLPIYMLYFLSFIYPCRMWCLISIENQVIVDSQNDLDFIMSEANYFQEIGAGYNTWSLFIITKNWDLDIFTAQMYQQY